MEKAKTWHRRHQENRTLGNKLADWMAAFVGSWTFVWIHITWFAFWVLIPIEPFPFGFLTMVVSLEAIMLATLIMMSQNRQSDRDRLQADADFETNLQAKKEIEDLQKGIVRLEVEKLDKIIKILESR